MNAIPHWTKRTMQRLRNTVRYITVNFYHAHAIAFSHDVIVTADSVAANPQSGVEAFPHELSRDIEISCREFVVISRVFQMGCGDRPALCSSNRTRCTCWRRVRGGACRSAKTDTPIRMKTNRTIRSASRRLCAHVFLLDYGYKRDHNHLNHNNDIANSFCISPCCCFIRFRWGLSPRNKEIPKCSIRLRLKPYFTERSHILPIALCKADSLMRLPDRQVRAEHQPPVPVIVA